MSKLMSYLPGSPIVVEGYSTAGPPDREYLVSRERVLAVSKYIESHFHLKPDRVGIMPLGEHPLHTGKQKWNGICLALVAYKK